MARLVESVVSSCIVFDQTGALLSGGVDGTVVKIDYISGQPIQEPLQVFKKPVRNIISANTFTFCSSANGYVASTSEQVDEILWRVKVSKDAISALCYLEDMNQLAIGTDSGDLIVIDCDDPKVEIFRVESHDDIITAISYNPAKKMLISVGGDGHVVATDVKRSNCGKEHGRSECLEDEVLSMVLVEKNSKIITGTGLGFVNIFNWGYYGVPSQRIKGFKSEINSICKVDDSRVIVGTSKGTCQFINGEKRGASITFEGHSIECMDHFDGRLAHLDQNGTIWLWSIEDLHGGKPTINITEDQQSKDNVSLDRQTFLDGFA